MISVVGCNMKNLVIYHSKDLDGWTSGWLLKTFLVGVPPTHFGFDYNETLSPFQINLIEKSDVIYLVDVSLPDDIMAKYAEKIIWIDHHDNRNKSLSHLPFKENETNHRFSASKLAFDYLARGKSLTESETLYLQDLIDLVDTYDMWRKNSEKFPDAYALNQYCFSLKTEDLWKELDEAIGSPHKLKSFITNAIQIGKLMMKAIDGFLDKIPVLESHNSITVYPVVAQPLCNKPRNTDILVMFQMRGIDDYSVSLRSETQNILPIAESYGGGGHPHAARFSANYNQLMDIIKNGFNIKN